MKKQIHNLITASLILISSISFAQPVLTATGMNPVIGENFTNNTANYVNPGSAGANQSWNLSTMSGTGALTNVVAPSSTANGTSFPNSNVAWSSSAGIDYYKTSTTALQNYGFFVNGTVMPYSNPEDFLRFPVAINNTFTDTWATQFISSSYTYYRTGSTTVTADAYGTLITPSGTYTNVMRVHFVQVYQDSVDLGFPYIITYNNDEYMWYKEGVHVQLATVYTLTSSAGGPYTGGSYFGPTTGIDNLSDFISSYTISPNPVSDQLKLHFTLKENKEVEVKLFNSLGEQVQINQSTGGIRGLNTMQLDVTALPEGIYFAQIILDGTVAQTKRFVVLK